MKLFQRLQP